MIKMMDYLEKIRQLSNFDYCTSDTLTSATDSSIFYQFGWKNGIHFYLERYISDDEFHLNVWRSKELIFISDTFNFDQIISDVERILIEYEEIKDNG